MSKLQRLARNRNWLKYRLFGITLPSTQTNVYTKTEKELIAEIQIILQKLKDDFDTQSSKLGLNVKNIKTYKNEIK